MFEAEPPTKLKEGLTCEIGLRLPSAIIQQLLVKMHSNILMAPLVQTSSKGGWIQINIDKLNPMRVTIRKDTIGKPALLKDAAYEKARCKSAILKIKSFYRCV
jgi:hypothetical protein